jgi:threonine/homoserine/homoserine lactone efflux protein
MLEVILFGIVTGVVISVPIGPANLELIKKGLTCGYVSAFKIGFGTALSDSLLSVLVYMGIVPLLLKNYLIHTILYLSGGIILIVLGAFSMYQTFTLEDPLSVPEEQSEWAHRYNNMDPILLGFFINITNPMVIGFWIMFVANTINSGYLGKSFLQLFLFSSSVLVGSSIWFGTLAAIVCWGKKYVGKGAFITISTICNSLMIICGGYFLLKVTGYVK